MNNFQLCVRNYQSRNKFGVFTVIAIGHKRGKYLSRAKQNAQERYAQRNSISVTIHDIFFQGELDNTKLHCKCSRVYYSLLQQVYNGVSTQIQNTLGFFFLTFISVRFSEESCPPNVHQLTPLTQECGPFRCSPLRLDQRQSLYHQAPLYSFAQLKFGLSSLSLLFVENCIPLKEITE